MVQGVAVAGEFNGASVLITEHDRKHPFLAGSWTSFASAAGMSVGSMAAAIVSMVNKGGAWRFPFLLSSLIALVAVYLRKDMPETEAFKTAKKNNELFKNPLLAAWQYNKRGLACTAAFSMFISVFCYTGNVYFKTMAVNIGGIPADKAALAVTFGVSLNTILIPFVACFADKFNGYKLCLIGLVSTACLAPLVMLSAQSGNFTYTMLGQVVYACLDAVMSATFFTVMLRQFNTGTKYSGSSFAWSISTAIFGGGTLMVNEFLVGGLKFAAGPGLYMAVSAIICLAVVLLVHRKKSDKELSV
jgi:MHS family proline/betaine transporter-like MFS transporter